jgi:hypothetical protein
MKFQLISVFLAALLPLSALAAPAAGSADVEARDELHARRCPANGSCFNGRCHCQDPCEGGLCGSYDCGAC